MRLVARLVLIAALARAPLATAGIRAGAQKAVGTLRSFGSQTFKPLTRSAPGGSSVLEKGAIATHVLATSGLLYTMAENAHDWKALLVPPLALAGYHAADLAIGAGHWALDGYGGADTPLVGAIIEKFVEHHEDPSDVTRLSRTHLATTFTRFSLPVLAAAALLGGDHLMLQSLALGFGTGAVLVPISHRYAHLRQPMGRVETLWLRAMRSTRLFISPEEHKFHHLSGQQNFEVGAGLTNWAVDKLKLPYRMAVAVKRTTGVAHRSWAGRGDSSTLPGPQLEK